MAKAIITMAHSLGLKVVAEGVEQEAQVAFLAENGCDEMQGFLLGRPGPAHEIAAIARQHAPKHREPAKARAKKEAAAAR